MTTAHAFANQWIIDDSEDGVFSVRAKAYCDPDIYVAEQKDIFDRCWLYAAHESEIAKPGDFLTRRVGARELLMVRGKDGELRAFLNICRHKGGTVCRERSGNASTFRCLYHSWTYTTQGKLAGVALKESYASGFDKDRFSLYPVRLESYRGLIFICYDETADGLKQFLSGAVEVLDMILDQYEGIDMTILPGAYEYTMSANWKMLMENSMDAYHAISVHTRFFNDYMPNVMGVKMSRNDLFGRTSEHVGVRDLGNGHSVGEIRRFAKNMDATKRSMWEEKYGKERTDRLINYNRNLLLFPNTIIAEQFPMIRTCFPLSADVTESTSWTLVPEQEDPAIRAGRLQGFTSFQGPGGFGTPDDIEVLEQCQRNCRELPADAYLDSSRGMKQEVCLPDDELQNRVMLREWRRQLDLPMGQG
ncbi:MAG: Rieske 2Fe-2S domain-containing protein [Sphingobium sp.]|nr:Rieske 2Fe-2S domain-containing protein [Sphingobium sp.]MCI2053497.1 Rieske 2Fe-2S domain-containing protein [Sphingobium sp.]